MESAQGGIIKRSELKRNPNGQKRESDKKRAIPAKTGTGIGNKVE
jgi:hypothetical protein